MMVQSTGKSVIDFTGYITERTHHFTGRAWVSQAITNWLADPNAPHYFIIVGEPGIGKTAMAARLTQLYDLAAVHFCITRQSDTLDPLNFVHSISHQLTYLEGFAQRLLEEAGIHIKTSINVQKNYGQIAGIQIERLIAVSTSATTAFVHTVIAPLKQMYLDGFEQQLVILVDALDEAVQYHGPENIVDLLANTQGLPSQVRFVLTSRPDSVALRHFEQLHIPYLLLNAEEAENLQDLRVYVQRQVEISQALQERLAEHAILLETFIDRVVMASEGNFLYLVFLLPAIADGTQQLDTLDALPKGLDEIYRELLRVRIIGKNIQDWRTFYRPLLGVLAAAHASLSVKQLALFTRLSEQETDDVLLDIQQFLDPVQASQGQYQFYHQSFSEFLRVRGQAKEFWVDLKSIHQLIVSSYRAKAPTWQEVNWAEVDNYGLLHLSTHLLEAEHFQEVLGLMDEPFTFLRAKVQHFQSYTEISVDLRNAMRASTMLQDRVKLLGLALAYSGLHAKVMHLATSRVIPLYARFGEPEKALKLAELISDETERAKALAAVAQELFSTDPNKSRNIIRQVLANWRSYPEGYGASEVLFQVLTFLPDELIAFLEELDTFSPFYSLGHSYSGINYDEIYQAASQLDLALQRRLREAFVKALALDAQAHAKSKLRFLLVCLEPDPVRAAACAETEVAQIIVQAKRERLEQPEGILTEQLLQQTIHYFLTRDASFNEAGAVIRFAVAPHAEQFFSALNRLDVSILTMEEARRLVDLIFSIGMVLVDWCDVEGAKKYLYEGLRAGELLSSLLNKSIYLLLMHPSSQRLLEQICIKTASLDLQNALDFLDLSEIVKLQNYIHFSTELSMPKILRTAAKTNPEVASVIVEQQWHDQVWAWEVLAEEVAHIDFERALTIWRKLAIPKSNKLQVLINLLYNTPLVMYQYAREVLEQEFTPNLPYQLYKIPTLLEIALGLKQDQPEQAQTIAVKAITNLSQQFEVERWGKLRRDFFLVRILPAVAACGFHDIAVSLLTVISEDFGCRKLAAADLLQVLVKDRNVPIPIARKKLPQLTSTEFEPTQTQFEDLSLDRIIGYLEFLISGARHLKFGPINVSSEAIVEFAELPSTISSTPLISLYLRYKAHHESMDWQPDYIGALLTKKAFPVYKEDALHFAQTIEDIKLRHLALVELYDKLPLKTIKQLDGIGQEALQAIAYIRIASQQLDSRQQQAWLDAAFKQAEKIYRDITDELTLDLLFQFIREAHQLRPKQSRQIAQNLVTAALTTSHHWRVERLFELSDCGYNFSVDEQAAIERQSDLLIKKSEKLVNERVEQVEEMHGLLAQFFSSIARSTMQVNQSRSLNLIERAIYHTSMVTEEVSRKPLHRQILKTLLTSKDPHMWEKAVWLSLDFGDAIFWTFDSFRHTLPTTVQEDKALQLRLSGVIKWAEQLMTI